MDIAHLIRMANQIGEFFDAMPDRPEAIEGIANHIQKFWEPRMRVELLAFLERHPDGANGDLRLIPIVLEAINGNRERLTPKAAVQ